jgi:hypothetical protein
VLNQHQGYWLLSYAPTTKISLIYELWANCLAFDYSETQVFDGELQILQQNMQNKKN